MSSWQPGPPSAPPSALPGALPSRPADVPPGVEAPPSDDVPPLPFPTLLGTPQLPTAPVLERRGKLIAAAGAALLVLVASIVLLVRGCSHPSGAVAVQTDTEFGLGVLVEKEGRVLVVTALPLVAATKRADAYVYREIDDADVAVGFPGSVVAVSRDAKIALLALQGVRPADVPIAKPADGPLPAPGAALTIVASEARFARQISEPIAKGKKKRERLAPADAVMSGDASRPGTPAFWISTQAPRTPGLIGAPVLEGKRLVGITVERGPDDRLLVTPAGVIAAALGGVTPASLADAEVADVEKELAAALDRSSVALAEVEKKWRALAWPRLADDPRPDRIRLLKDEALPAVAEHVAPTDVGALQQRAAELAAQLSDTHPLRRDEQAVKVEPEQVLRALAFTKLRYLIGVGEKPRVLSVARGALEGSFEAQIVDAYGDTRTICALREHGRIFASLFRCASVDSPRAKIEPAWFGDRELGDRLIGNWAMRDDANGVMRRLCKDNYIGACLREGSSVRIEAVRGATVTARAVVRHLGHAERTSRGIHNFDCAVSVEHALTGTLQGGVVRLAGAPPPSYDLIGTYGTDAKTRVDICRKLGQELRGSAPRVRAGDVDSISLDDLRIDLRIDRIGARGDTIDVLVFWHGALAPWSWGVDGRDDDLHPLTFTLTRDESSQ